MTDRLLKAVTVAGAMLFVNGATAADIAPHRAAYALRLIDPGTSRLTGAEGQMLFVWDRSCDGWTTEQRITLTMVGAEGNPIETASQYVTFETLDGTAMTFRSEDQVRGRRTELVSGEATLGPEGGEALFREPEERRMAIPAGALFPTEHTIRLIDHALAGDRFFNALVFDGADEEGLSEITAVIGGPLEPLTDETVDDLLREPGWAVILAFFSAAQQEAEPTSEVRLELLQNGVVRSLRIDYGDFVLDGTLLVIEPLDPSSC